MHLVVCLSELSCLKEPKAITLKYGAKGGHYQSGVLVCVSATKEDVQIILRMWAIGFFLFNCYYHVCTLEFWYWQETHTLDHADSGSVKFYPRYSSGNTTIFTFIRFCWVAISRFLFFLLGTRLRRFLLFSLSHFTLSHLLHGTATCKNKSAFITYLLTRRRGDTVAFPFFSQLLIFPFSSWGWLEEISSYFSVSLHPLPFLYGTANI